MKLADYLRGLDTAEPMQEQWYARLRDGCEDGTRLLQGTDEAGRRLFASLFRDWVRTEETKAWYSEPERGSLFQGTSVTSLTVPWETDEPLPLTDIHDLEDQLVTAYVALHDRHEAAVRRANQDNVDKWVSEGLYFGIVIGSKILAQAFGLSVDAAKVVFPVDGVMVDPHEITTYPESVRTRYFQECLRQLDCFDGLCLDQSEMEESLALADISKPRIERWRGKLLLGPVRCNEIAAMLSRRLTRAIAERTQGRIAPRSLQVTIYDTDTPYTYHQIAGYYGRTDAPTLPGLTCLGASGSIDAFRWLYAYRASLIAQKMMKSSLWSEVERRYVPFVFLGVLVERDAEILLDLDRLGLLRYRGNLSPLIEYSYLVPRLKAYLAATRTLDAAAHLDQRLR